MTTTATRIPTAADQSSAWMPPCESLLAARSRNERLYPVYSTLWYLMWRTRCDYVTKAMSSSVSLFTPRRALRQAL